MKLFRKIIIVLCSILFVGSINSVFPEALTPEVSMQLGQKSIINNVVYSPDFKKLLSSSFNNDIKLWDLITNDEIRSYTGNKAPAASLCFSSDGNSFVSGSYKGEVSLWDINKNEPVMTFNNQKKQIISVFFSGDGSKIISLSLDGTYIVRDKNSGDILKKIKNVGLLARKSEVSMNKKFLVIAYKNKYVKLWDIENEKFINRIILDAETINRIFFMSDNRRILIGTRDGSAYMYDIFEGKRLISFSDNLRSVLQVAATKDQKSVIVISTTYDYYSSKNDVKIQTKINIWDISNTNSAILKKKVVENFSGYTFDKNFKILLATSLIVSDDRKYFICGSFDNRIILYDLDTCISIKNINEKKIEQNEMVFSSDAKYAVISSKGRSYIIWDLLNCNVYKNIKMSFSECTPLKFSLEKNYILYKTLSGKLVYHYISENKDEVISDFLSFLKYAEISPDEKYLIVSTYKAPLMLYDMTSRKFIKDLIKKKIILKSLCFSPDSKSIIAAWDNNKILISDIVKNKNIFLNGHKKSVVAVVCSPDGKYIISSGNDKTLKIWDVQTRVLIKEFSKLSSEITLLKISGDSRFLLAADRSAAIKLFDLKELKELYTYTGHTYQINSLQFSPDNKYFLSGSYDGTIRLWGMNNDKKEIARYTVFIDDEWVVMTPDGYFNLSPNGKGYIKNLKLDNYIDLAYFNHFYKPDLIKERIKNLE